MFVILIWIIKLFKFVIVQVQILLKSPDNPTWRSGSALSGTSQVSRDGHHGPRIGGRQSADAPGRPGWTGAMLLFFLFQKNFPPWCSAPRGHNPRWTFLARSIQRTVSRLPVARPCTRASPSVSRCIAPRCALRSVPSLNLIIFRALGLQWPVLALRRWRDQEIQRWAWQYPPGGRG